MGMTCHWESIILFIKNILKICYIQVLVGWRVDCHNPCSNGAQAHKPMILKLRERDYDKEKQKPSWGDKDESLTKSKFLFYRKERGRVSGSSLRECLDQIRTAKGTANVY